MKMNDPESQKFKTGTIPGSMPSMHVLAMFRPTSGFITFSLALGSLEREPEFLRVRYPAIPRRECKD